MVIDSSFNNFTYFRALREKVLAQAVDGAQDDGLYRGMNNYTDHRKGFRREHTIGAEKGGGSHGPLRAPTNIRMTVRFDYQPDICKVRFTYQYSLHSNRQEHLAPSLLTELEPCLSHLLFGLFFRWDRHPSAISQNQLMSISLESQCALGSLISFIVTSVRPTSFRMWS